ncbi:hypothetical protein CASFOL_037796 [Castilleja foliolosa]|uniref:SHSP domain-containing protein n=1 Tax=Castilleja foliolosa TaxID=1961234 RepID=A0ABD3BJ59_9LAMI
MGRFHQSGSNPVALQPNSLPITISPALSFHLGLLLALTPKFNSSPQIQFISLTPAPTARSLHTAHAASLSPPPLWRFWLPASTLPELASATYDDGELVVTVPKDVAAADEEDDGAEGLVTLLYLHNLVNGVQGGVDFAKKVRGCWDHWVKNMGDSANFVSFDFIFIPIFS